LTTATDVDIESCLYRCVVSKRMILSHCMNRFMMNRFTLGGCHEHDS